MANVIVGLDEWYVWSVERRLGTGKTPRSYERMLEVDEATAKRWERAVKQFREASEEISRIINTQDLEAMRAGTDQ